LKSNFLCHDDNNYSGVEIKNGEYTQVITKTLYQDRNRQASIVEVRNKHGNGDEFPDAVICFGIKNVRVGGKILGSVGRSETDFFFQSYNGRDVNSPFHMEREVRPLTRNSNFQSTIAVYIF
jgi:hypothetical protein